MHIHRIWKTNPILNILECFSRSFPVANLQAKFIFKLHVNFPIVGLHKMRYSHTWHISLMPCASSEAVSHSVSTASGGLPLTVASAGHPGKQIWSKFTEEQWPWLSGWKTVSLKKGHRTRVYSVWKDDGQVYQHISRMGEGTGRGTQLYLICMYVGKRSGQWFQVQRSTLVFIKSL